MIVMMHGWGYDRTVWRHMLPVLDGLPVITPDLGFFGPSDTPDLSKGCLGVGHSLGFLWLLKNAGASCARLMSVAGFPRFAGAADYSPAVAPRLIARMQAQFAEAPDNVLRDFWARCGGPGPDSAPDRRRLGDGLDWLAHWDGRAALAAYQGQVDVVAGLDDPIVPPAMAEMAFAERDIAWRPGGHLLPLTDAAYLAARIREAWREIAR